MQSLALLLLAAKAGGAFLVLHSLVHAGDLLTGGFEAHHLMHVPPGVSLMALLTLPSRKTLTKENFDVDMDRAAPARRH
ncbi:MAG TPA: hypothetical protein VJ698_18010 [Noviherbaspirillum sp.]|uniref:hypothetical protein n=1 Tax=Noviherbaspirillum sp. TaxID=1926288 RepID=UPI002B48B386|nr:hypothetical protein [Noviherbaspirillum sp.]HJV87368.1 hypothetical protein [Noviherbaspirillum sp.]